MKHQAIQVDARRFYESKGENGEIPKTYSGDTIINGKIRGTFQYQGKLYVCTGVMYKGKEGMECTCSEVIPLKLFQGQPITYGEKKEFGYYGVKVKSGGTAYVLVHSFLFLPDFPASLPSEEAQLSLF